MDRTLNLSIKGGCIYCLCVNNFSLLLSEAECCSPLLRDHRKLSTFHHRASLKVVGRCYIDGRKEEME